MALIWTTIRDLPSGEFLTATQGEIEASMAEAARWLDEGYWGDDYDDAHLYLTAHLLSGWLTAGVSESGIASWSAGPFSVSFGSSRSSEWNTTIYGQRYAWLLRSRRATPMMVF